MAIVFKFILGMTMTGSILFILIFLITPITKRIFSSRWHCYSHITVLLFFFLPIGAAAAKTFEKITYLLLMSGSTALSDFWQEIPTPLAITAFYSEAQASTLRGGILESILVFLPFIWFAGASLFLLFKFFQLARFKKMISKSSVQISDKTVLAVFEKVKKDMQVHSRIELLSNSGISTPILIGLVSTQLILPKTDLGENELELVFRHELIHYLRGDLRVKFAAMIACAVHWFNPLVYLLANSIDSFLETSCDAEVVKNMDYDERRVYGAAILNVLGSAAGRQTSVYAAFSSGQKNMKARLTTMLNEKKPSKKTAVISILVILLICVAGISVSAAAHKETRIVEALIYTPIDGSQNPLDYMEIERTENQEKAIGAADEIGVPQYAENDPMDSNAPDATYTPKNPLEVNASAARDESEVPNPLDFPEGTQPVLTSFIWPTENGGYISTGFQEYEGHTGMDIKVPEDTPVYASANGIVVKAVNSNVGYGKYIVIDHGGGYQTLYAHCSSLDVNEGDFVEAGQAIASVGRSGNATGFHLHFEIRSNGRIMNPEDYLNVEKFTAELPQ